MKIMKRGSADDMLDTFKSALSQTDVNSATNSGNFGANLSNYDTNRRWVECSSGQGNTIGTSGAGKSVQIPEYAEYEFYSDAGGGFGGTEEDVYSLADIMRIWNSENAYDPSMQSYSSFNEWWNDTRSFMKPISEDSSIYSSSEIDPWESDEFEGFYNEQNGIDNWEQLETKQVLDSDGFYTEYTLYRNLSGQSPRYGCVFGDRDLYKPEDGYFDFETDDENEAYEWFSSYTGFEDDEIYTASELQPEESCEQPEDEVYGGLFGNKKKQQESGPDDLKAKLAEYQKKAGQVGDQLDALQNKAFAKQKSVNSSTSIDEDQLWEIANRYTTSSPISSDWDTELEHELHAIMDEMGLTEQQALDAMIKYLGFDYSDFADAGIMSSTSVEGSMNPDDQTIPCPYCTMPTSRELVGKYGMCWDCYDNGVE